MRLILYFIFLLPAIGFAQGDNLSSELFESRTTKLSQLLLSPRLDFDTVSIRQVHYFPANDTFIHAAVILPLLDTTLLEFSTSDGKLKSYRPYAKLYFNYAGAIQQLTVYQSLALAQHPLYRDKLFLPFYDFTNGFESYGGGRYLDISKKAVDAREVMLDFNQAYNPWCAYSDQFSCPIPPIENRLTYSIRAGEAAFTKPGL